MGLLTWSEIIEESVSARRDLHKIPEIAWHEEKTSAYIKNRLEQLGISCRSCAGTGVVAVIAQDAGGGGVGLRADMDGMAVREEGSVDWRSRHDGCMHCCGHDGHMAILLGAASWLKQHEAKLQQPVILLFQPAEEGGFGAREMIGDGALSGVSQIFGWHNWPTIDFGKAVCPSGPVMAANGSFQVILHGKGGHASQPEACRDPVLAAAELTMSLQHIVSRRLIPNRAAVVSVTAIEAPSRETVIPDTAKLAGSVRVERDADLSVVGDHFHQIAGGIAAAHGLEAEVIFKPRYPAVCNDAQASAQMRGALTRILGEHSQCLETPLPVMASEDFSYYLDKVPGAFALVGTTAPGETVVPCHNSGYDFNDRLVEPMIRVLIDLATAGQDL